MFAEGIFPIGDGLLDIDENRFKELLVEHDINEIYDVEQTPFARGKFAAVRRAIHKNSGVHFAAKFLKRRRRAQSSDKEIKHEIAVLLLCDGAENIVKLNAVHESRSDTALLLELATGGELQTFLDNEECLSEAQARICMREVLKALQFLHKRSIAHLDLKPQNILLNGERIEDGLKLCDFGISRVVAEGTNVREIVGTPDYVAPEVLQYEPLSLLTDIWSVGVLTYVLLSGFSPFGGETKQETFLNISQCALTFPDKLFGGVSSAAIDFMRRALRIKPTDRMTAAGCLEHIWLKDECSIDRQIFNNVAKKTATTKDVDEDEMAHDHVDDCDDDNDCEDDDCGDVDCDVEVEIEECDESIEVENDEEDDEEQEVDDNNEIDEEDHEETDDNNALLLLNGSDKMDSSDAAEENQQQHLVCNGKVAHNNTTATTNGTNCKSLNTTKMQTTTAIVTVPAIRATTIPLFSALQQQQPLLVARRHSSDSNKENTFLATKKILPSMSNKKPMSIAAAAAASATTTSTATATIIIAPPTESTTTMPSSSSSNVVAKITLPNSGGSNGNDKNATSAAAAAAPQCFFPDAPTTPKVIRKAPTTDTSPTSVKALVKKFQLEGSNCEKSPPHLKETQTTNHQQHTNGKSHNSVSRKSSITTSPTTNGKISVKSLEKQCTIVEQNKKTNKNYSNSHHINGNSNIMHHSSISNGGRRSSEPITGVIKKLLPTAPIVTASATVPTTAAAATTTTNVTSYKSTSVYCLTCGNTSSTITTTGCRHSGVAASVTTTTTNGSNNSIASASSPTTANGSISSSSSSTSAAAILLSNHQQLQHHHHHHHHHHHVAKNAANNLSLDHGIIC